MSTTMVPEDATELVVINKRRLRAIVAERDALRLEARLAQEEVEQEAAEQRTRELTARRIATREANKDGLSARPADPLQELSAALAEGLTVDSSRVPAPPLWTYCAKLTSRPMEVLKLAHEGLPTQQIAEEMNIKAVSVDSYFSIIRKRMGVRTVAAAIDAAKQRGWIV